MDPICQAQIDCIPSGLEPNVRTWSRTDDTNVYDAILRDKRLWQGFHAQNVAHGNFKVIFNTEEGGQVGGYVRSWLDQKSGASVALLHPS